MNEKGTKFVSHDTDYELISRDVFKPEFAKVTFCLETEDANHRF